MCKRVPSLCPCGVAHASPLVGSAVFTLHTFISHRSCGFCQSARAPAAPHSSLGLMLAQIPAGTPRHGSSICAPPPQLPSSMRVACGGPWQGCNTTGQLLALPHKALAAALSLQGPSSCYNFLFYFFSS